MPTDFWNSRYAEPGYAYGTEPNAFLVSQKKYLKPGGKALAVADGEGRNGVWLAQQGLDVLSVDISEIGLCKTHELAADRGVAIRTEKADLITWQWPVQKFDIVVAIYAHFPPEVRARLHRRMFEALKPGGVLILEAFTPEQLKYKTGGPSDVERLYTRALLEQAFGDFSSLEIEEHDSVVSEGSRHVGMAALIDLVGRK